ncbi:MAG: GNAT family N-acetyltransferase [Thermoplasmata archaeon]
MVEIRELRRRDIPSYERVILSGIGELERAIGIDQTVVPLIRTLRRPGVWILYFLSRAVGRSIRILVAVEQGRIVSTTSVVPRKTVGVVVGVATEPAARGRGIATQLLQEAHRIVREKGTPWLALDVESTNLTALRIYQRLGYREVARFTWFVGDLPPPESAPRSTMSDLSGPRLRAVLPWVEEHRSADVRGPFPATPRMLSHVELLFALPGSKSKTWGLPGAHGPTGVVRGYYAPINATAYLIPAAWESSLPPDAFPSLLEPGIEWARGLGASRIVASVPEPIGAWDATMTSVGLKRSVSTSLMIRSSTD